MIFGKGFYGRGRFWPAAVLGLASPTGCAPPLENVVFRNDYEQAAAPLASREYAHSAKQSLKTGQPHEYNNLTDRTWQALGRPHHLRLRLWARLPDAQLSFARLVLDVRRPGAPGVAPGVLHSEAVNLCEIIKRYRQWEPTTVFFSLPKELRPTDRVLIFMWVPPSQNSAVYVDDFSLENLD